MYYGNLVLMGRIHKRKIGSRNYRTGYTEEGIQNSLTEFTNGIQNSQTQNWIQKLQKWVYRRGAFDGFARNSE